MRLIIPSKTTVPSDAESLFAHQCVFWRSVTHISQLPGWGSIEIAFAGRSNVGKSSVINAMTMSKKMARISNTPGRTRELNFFALGQHAYLVDLPGYGYAKAPRSKIDAWNQLMTSYLSRRAQLKRVILLIDARHGLKPVDHQMMNLLDHSALVYQTVLTKADKVTEAELARQHDALREALCHRPAAHTQVLITSSRNRKGIAELRNTILDTIKGHLPVNERRDSTAPKTIITTSHPETPGKDNHARKIAR